MPAPLIDMPPTPSMSIDAVKDTRADCESAVVLAACATGSNENVSPPQPASTAADNARHSSVRRRRALIASEIDAASGLAYPPTEARHASVCAPRAGAG